MAFKKPSPSSAGAKVAGSPTKASPKAAPGKPSPGSGGSGGKVKGRPARSTSTTAPGQATPAARAGGPDWLRGEDVPEPSEEQVESDIQRLLGSSDGSKPPCALDLALVTRLHVPGEAGVATAGLQR